MELSLRPARACSVKDAAERLGISISRVQQELRSPDHPLGGFKDGRSWLVDADEVDRQAALRAAMGGRPYLRTRPAGDPERDDALGLHLQLLQAELSSAEKTLLTERIKHLGQQLDQLRAELARTRDELDRSRAQTAALLELFAANLRPPPAR